MGVQDLVREIEQRRQQALERKASPYPRNQPVASDLGPCDRELVYQITNWKDRPAFTRTSWPGLNGGPRSRASSSGS